MTEARRGAGRVRRGTSRVLTIAALVPVFAFGLGGAAYADVTAVTGSAFGISANLTTALGVGATLAPTPTVTLPAAGSPTPITDTVVSAGLPGLLSTGVLTATTQGTLGPSGSVQSSAQVAGLSVGLAALPALAADAVGSTCTSNEAGSTGDTTVANIRVLGLPIAVATAPNTVVNLAVGTLHVNEQIVTGTAPSSSITVNAIRLELNVAGLATGEVVVGRSVCGVNGTGVVVPTGAVGGVMLTGLAAVVFGVTQIRRYRRGGPTPA